MSTSNTEKATLVLGGRTDNYIAKAILLDEAVMPIYVRLTIWLAVAAIAGFVAWASYARLDIVATAPGQIVPSAAVQVIQHVDGGRIASIDVAEGDRVKKGQLLMALNRAEAEADLETTKARYWTLAVRVERLKAFAEGRQPDYGRVPGRYREVIADQKSILVTSRKALADQEAVLRAQIAQLEADATRTREEIGILKEVDEIRADLQKERLVTRVQLLDSRRTLVQQQGELARITQQLEEKRGALKGLSSDRNRAAMDEMGTAQAELAQVEEQLAKSTDRLDRVEVRSPADGIVQDLRFRTVGGVVAPGATVMNVVPVDKVLRAEVRVSTTDVGHVKPGQEVRVKVGTYDFLRYGTVEGKVAVVPAFSVTDEKNNPYFKVLVELSRQHVGKAAGDKPIEPGMTVQADIVTDRQTVMQYLLRPVFVAFRQGLRER